MLTTFTYRVCLLGHTRCASWGTPGRLLGIPGVPEGAPCLQVSRSNSHKRLLDVAPNLFAHLSRRARQIIRPLPQCFFGHIATKPSVPLKVSGISRYEFRTRCLAVVGCIFFCKKRQMDVRAGLDKVEEQSHRNLGRQDAPTVTHWITEQAPLSKVRPNTSREPPPNSP